MQRFSLPRRGQTLMLGTVATLAVAAMAAASSPAQSGGSRAAIPSGPPTPPCHAQAGFGCFVPAAPEPGTAIPSSEVNFSMRPAADNAFYIVGIQKGWYSDLGIKVNGFKATNDNAIPLAVKNQNNLGGMFGGSVIQVLNTQKNLKMVMFADDYLAQWLWASPKLKLKPVSYYVSKGMPFNEALKKALQPVIANGGSIATLPSLETRPILNLMFGMAGLRSRSSRSSTTLRTSC